MRALPSLGLVALLSACAAQPAYTPSDPYPVEAAYSTPIRARIVDVSGRISITTNRPAYVAIFEVVPGQGVGLLYPAYRGERNRLSSGYSTLMISQSRSYYSYFQAGPANRRAPRYLYLIASDTPLRLSHLVGQPGALRRTLGLTSYASSNPYGVMSELQGLVLPYGESANWTDDVYVIWPQQTYQTRYASTQWVRMRCPDGRVLTGPAYYMLGACDQGRPPTRTNPETPREPRDSTAGGEPTRRRPGEPEPANPGARTGEVTRLSPRAPIIEVMPEPGAERLRPGTWRTDPGERRTGDLSGGSVRDERSTPPVQPRTEPRVEPRRGGEDEPRMRPRMEEPRSEPRQEPRAEAPRSEPRETPRVESRPEPRAETPRMEAPRAEAPRSEPARVEPPRTEEARIDPTPPAR